VKKEVTGVRRKLHNEELQNLLFSEYNENDQVKEEEMGRACSTNWGEEECM
jgi:hypothetical protein